MIFLIIIIALNISRKNRDADRQSILSHKVIKETFEEQAKYCNTLKDYENYQMHVYVSVCMGFL